MKFPYVHVAGDTLDFEVEVPDYPSTDGWTLKYYLNARFTTPTQAQIVITATANDDGTYQVQASPTDTADWKPGAYGWARRAEKVGAAQTLASSWEQGEFEVRQNPATATQGYDSRSHARKMLEAIEATLQGKASDDQKAYTIGSRSVDKFTPKELEAWRDYYRREVAAENAEAGLDSGRGARRLFASL